MKKLTLLLVLFTLFSCEKEEFTEVELIQQPSEFIITQEWQNVDDPCMDYLRFTEDSIFRSYQCSDFEYNWNTKYLLSNDTLYWDYKGVLENIYYIEYVNADSFVMIRVANNNRAVWYKRTVFVEEFVKPY